MQNITKTKSLQDFFNSKKYKRLNIYQKELLLFELFHSKNFYSIKEEERIYLLQEFENNQAKIQNREPYKIVILNENYKIDEYLMDFLTIHSNKKIYARKDLIEKGKKQYFENKKIIKREVQYINIFLLDCIIHEGYHNNTNKSIDKYPFEKLPLEHKEQVIFYVYKNITCLKNSLNYLLNDEYYIYRMIPDEYYAFLYTETKIKKYFSKLNKKYGKDKNLDLYLQELEKDKKIIELSYSKIKSIKYDEIYNLFLNNYVKVVLENINKQELIEELNNSKRLIKIN